MLLLLFVGNWKIRIWDMIEVCINCDRGNEKLIDKKKFQVLLYLFP